MYHSVTFGDKNSWEDWHLIPSSRPVINPPEPKTMLLDIPGESGAIDLSESLTGYPLFKNRTGSIEFIVSNNFHEAVDIYQKWSDVYSDIMDHLHNKKMPVILEDDPDWEYYGRLTVNSWKSEEFNSRITIDYNLDPYKQFPDGHFKDLNATTTQQSYTFTKYNDHLGLAPCVPRINVFNTASTNTVDIRFVNSRLFIDTTVSLKPGLHEIPRIVFYGDSFTMYYRSESDTATVRVFYDEGRL